MDTFIHYGFNDVFWYVYTYNIGRGASCFEQRWSSVADATITTLYRTLS